MNKHRDLTDAEIANLSLEMRCCYFLHPWNVSMTGTTIAEWADQIGFMRYGSVSDAISEAEDLVSFVRTEIDAIQKQRDELEQRLAECRHAKQSLQGIIDTLLMDKDKNTKPSSTDKLKLFVWTGVCTEYTLVLAFAIAETESEAKKLVIKEQGYGVHDWDWGYLKVIPISKCAYSVFDDV